MIFQSCSISACFSYQKYDLNCKCQVGNDFFIQGSNVVSVSVSVSVSVGVGVGVGVIFNYVSVSVCLRELVVGPRPSAKSLF